MNEKGFEGLKVWQKAHGLMLDVHKKLIPLILKASPDERFNLISQIRRSSKSVPANIAEGHGRFYYGDNVRFCYNARGSLDETVSHLIAAIDLGYCPQSLFDDLRAQAIETRRMLNGYIDWLKEKKIGEKEPGASLYIREEQPDYILDPEHYTD
ncbi:MAG: four helix bundle protein [Anaerolineae bacterium]|jgi:four helix bundle protein|nr:four helix bundle protein [Anaerolineae bacterium]